METNTILAGVAIASATTPIMGFLAAQHWNLKKLYKGKTDEHEARLDDLQLKTAEQDAEFALVNQKLQATESAIEKLESTVTTHLGKIDDKLDKMLELIIQSRL